MAVAGRAAAAGALEGLVVVADEQTAGRGRWGRTWSSPAGAGLYFSVVLRPPPGVPLPLVTLAAGVCVREGILDATGLDALVKWPNDIIVERRKLCGILAEGVAIGTPAQAVVLGVGVNVRAAAHPPDVAASATSIEEELGRAVDADALLPAILERLDAASRALRDGRADDILRRWRAAAPTVSGAPVEWDTPGGTRTGVTRGIDEAGALLVATPQGIERIVAGEVRVRW